MGVMRSLKSSPEARKVPERTRGAACARAAGPSGQSVPSWNPFSRRRETIAVCAAGCGIPGPEAGPEVPCVWALPSRAARAPADPLRERLGTGKRSWIRDSKEKG